MGFTSGGAIDAKEGKRKELDNWLKIGRITPEQYRLALEKEGLTDVFIGRRFRCLENHRLAV